MKPRKFASEIYQPLVIRFLVCKDNMFLCSRLSLVNNDAQLMITRAQLPTRQETGFKHDIAQSYSSANSRWLIEVSSKSGMNHSKLVHSRFFSPQKRR